MRSCAALALESFPVRLHPGGPCRNRLWPPAAATSSAGTGRCGRARREVGLLTGAVRLGLAVGDGRGSRSPRSTSTASCRCSTPTTSSSATSAASRARLRGTNKRGEAVAPGAPRRPPARRGPTDVAGERQLADDRAADERVARELAARREDRDRERQVEARADLAQVGRRQVDRDPLLREHEAGVRERRPDALARLAHRLVGQPDDLERRQPVADVGLDPDPPRRRRRPARTCRRARGSPHQNAPSRWSRRTSVSRSSTTIPIASSGSRAKNGALAPLVEPGPASRGPGCACARAGCPTARRGRAGRS